MRYFTEKEDKFLKDNYLTVPAKRMAKMLGRSESCARQRIKLLGIIVPPEVIEKFKKESRFNKGHVSFNKGKKQTDYMAVEAIEKTKATRFHKGNRPCNTKEKDGVITIRYDHVHRNGKPYKYIRISLGKWVPLHQHLWEKENGNIQKGMCLWFKDQNPLNCELENLELITRAENMKRNTLHNYGPEVAKATQLRGVLNRQINKHLKNIKNEK